MIRIRGNGFIALEISKYLKSQELRWVDDYTYRIRDGYVELSCTTKPKYELLVALKFSQ